MDFLRKIHVDSEKLIFLCILILYFSLPCLLSFCARTARTRNRYDGSQRVNTFHAFSFSDQRWTPVLPSAHSSPPPSPRDRHIAVAFRNSVYIQGGFDGHSRVSDFWLFDLSTMCWREVLAVQGRPPTPRHSHAAVVYNSSLWLFGGYVLFERSSLK